MRKVVEVLVVCWLVAEPAQPRVFYVAPGGSPAGDGTPEKPWSLTVALAAAGRVEPGDTVCLIGGTYTVNEYYFRSRLQGTEDRFITVRPCGRERVTIEGGIEILAPWIIFRDLEVTFRTPTRISRQMGSSPTDVILPTGFVSHVPNVKVIHNVVHDLANGLASWREASNNEFYGNIVYYNGWRGADRSHGHGLYMQNEGKPKVLADNIFFNQFELGLQIYGTSATKLDNFTLDGNIVFNSGIMGGRYSRNILLGGTVLATGPVLTNNITYFPTDWNHGGDNNIGYYDSGAGCSALRLEGNYFVSGGIALTLHKCTIESFQENTFFGDVRNVTAASYPRNVYLDRRRPQGSRVFVRPSRYEAGRAAIAVFNWDRAAVVDVDVAAAGLRPGDRYEVRDVQNLFNTPVLEGIWDGEPLRLPMFLTAIAPPIGTVPVDPAHTDPEFAVFLLRRLDQAPAVVHAVELEAENGGLSGALEILDDAVASEGRAVANPGGGPGNLEFEVALPAGGEYALWIRSRPQAGRELMLTVAVDGEREEVAGSAPVEHGSWMWSKVSTRSLGMGRHHLALSLDALEVDRLILTNDLSTTPE